MTKIVFVCGANAVDREKIAEELRVTFAAQRNRVLFTRIEEPIELLGRKWFGWNGTKDRAGRCLIQYIKNDVAQDGPAFWANHIFKLLSMMGDEWDYVVVPDCPLDQTRLSEKHGLQGWVVDADSQFGKNIFCDACYEGNGPLDEWLDKVASPLCVAPFEQIRWWEAFLTHVQ